jgi:hypothetical protein
MLCTYERETDEWHAVLGDGDSWFQPIVCGAQDGSGIKPAVAPQVHACPYLSVVPKGTRTPGRRLMANDRLYMHCRECGGVYLLARIPAGGALQVPDIDPERLREWVLEHDHTDQILYGVSFDGHTFELCNERQLVSRDRERQARGIDCEGYCHDNGSGRCQVCGGEIE